MIDQSHIDSFLAYESEPNVFHIRQALTRIFQRWAQPETRRLEELVQPTSRHRAQPRDGRRRDASAHDAAEARCVFEPSWQRRHADD